MAIKTEDSREYTRTGKSFTSHSTRNRQFWRGSPSQSLGLVWKN